MERTSRFVYEHLEFINRYVWKILKIRQIDLQFHITRFAVPARKNLKS